MIRAAEETADLERAAVALLEGLRGVHLGPPWLAAGVVAAVRYVDDEGAERWLVGYTQAGGDRLEVSELLEGAGGAIFYRARTRPRRRRA